jgi:hypothetical protein
MTKKYFLFLAIFFIFLQFKLVFADTVKLIEGTFLIGKIIDEDKKSIVFGNLYGTFKINRNNIIEIFRTANYTEDIEILKKQHIGINEELIKKNVDSGQEKNLKLIKESSVKKNAANNLWTNGRISFSGTFNYVTGKVNEKLPYGYSGHLAFDQGLDKIPGKRQFLMPGIRLETGYNYFSHGSFNISGYTAALGPLWTLPSIKDFNGCFVFTIIPGISFLNIKNNDSSKSAQSNTFTGMAILGYMFSKGNYSIFLNMRYMYLYDKDVPMHTIGGEIGFGYNLW